MIHQKTVSFIEKNIVFIIIFTYFFYMFGFYFGSDYFFFIREIKFGYLLGGDSKRYILGSEKILNLEIPERKSYIGYMIYIALFKYFNLNLTYVVFSQIFLTFLSSLCIYKISEKLSSRFGGILCITLYLFYFPLQVWNFYILTETIFICSIIFIIFFFVFFKKIYIPVIIFLVIFTISIRPHGIILIPGLFLSTVIWLYLNNNMKIFWFSIISISFLFYPTIKLFNVFLTDQNIQELIAGGGIIWGYENADNYLNYKISDDNKNNLISLIIFLINNIDIVILSFFKKIWFFLARVRPYYSELHNIYIIIFNIIYYPLAIIGFIKLKSKKTLGSILAYLLISLFTLTAGITYADWDSRFSLYITPLIFIFSGIGISEIIRQRNIKSSKIS